MGAFIWRLGLIFFDVLVVLIRVISCDLSRLVIIDGHVLMLRVNCFEFWLSKPLSFLLYVLTLFICQALNKAVLEQEVDGRFAALVISEYVIVFGLVVHYALFDLLLYVMLVIIHFKLIFIGPLIVLLLLFLFFVVLLIIIRSFVFLLT